MRTIRPLLIVPALSWLALAHSVSAAGIPPTRAAISTATLNFAAAFGGVANHPPVFPAMGNLATVTGKAVAIPAVASDADGDLLTYGATGLPAGVTIASDTGFISGTPTVPDVYAVTISAYDGRDTSYVSFTWTVSTLSNARVTFIQSRSSSAVTGPSAISVPFATAQLASSLDVVVVGWNDPAAQVQSVTDTSGNIYQLAAGPASLSGVGSQSVYYASNVAAAGAGANTVTVAFTSPAALAEVRVTEYQGIAPTNVVDVTSNGSGSGSIAAAGPAATTFRNDLLFGAVWVPGATTLPAGDFTARLTTPTGTLLEDATIGATGSYTMQASVDPSSPWLAQLVAFRDVNHAPVLTNPGNQTNVVGVPVSFALSATDQDNDPLTYTASGLPLGVSVDPSTGVVSGTVTRAGAGFHTVTVSVSDGALSASTTFAWTAKLASGVIPLRRSDDVDGDGRSDIINTFRSTNGGWRILTSSSNFTTQLGVPLAVTNSNGSVPGDYDGDGKADLAYFYPQGTWQILTAASNFSSGFTDNFFGAVPVPGDYDGDGKTDEATYYSFYPSWGRWRIKTASGVLMNFNLGNRTDIPVPGDYDGDGKIDPAVYRPLIHTWRILLSSTNYTTTRVVTFGSGVDVPVPADYDGDGITDIAVYRRATGQWIIQNSSTGLTTTTIWGNGTDIPAPGDYDGDGKADLAVFRLSSTPSKWCILQSSDAAQVIIPFGGPEEVPATVTLIEYAIQQLAVPQVSEVTRAGDLDGDGKTDLTVFRPSNGTWYTLKSSQAFSPASQTSFAFGTSTDIPVPGDYDGDGITDRVFFRPSTAEWNIAQSFGGFPPYVIQFGASGDLPVPADYDGDGLTDIAVYHTGQWQIRFSGSGQIVTRTWGWPTDIPVPGDYDGDSIADVAVYRPLTGEWRILLSTSGNTTSRVVTLGGATDIPVPGDYDGDGITDLAVYQKASGQWQILLSSTGATITMRWGGAPGDIPVPGDYDGDGKTDLAIYRGGTWWVLESHSNFTTQWSVAWGSGADQPALGPLFGNAKKVQARRRITDTTRASDFDGDGRSDVVVYRPSAGTWYILTSGSNYSTQSSIAWGTSTDIPVAGDYDGDGKTDPAYFRPSTGEWKILYSSSNYVTSVTLTLGNAGDMPVPGDYDGDGKTDIAIFHPPTGQWQIRQSSTGTTTTTTWGAKADIPVPADYDGDGRTDLAVYRLANGQWQVLPSGGGPLCAGGVTSHGGGGFLPVAGDFDGDGRADIGTFNRSTGSWEISNCQTGYPWFHTLGSGTDVPVPGDFDGDGRVDFAVYRNGRWVVDRSSDGTTILTVSWGGSGDTAVPNVVATNTSTVLARPKLSLGMFAGDVDGDGRTDISVYRPSNGTWYTLTSQSQFLSQTSHPWGTSTDIPVPGDYDGDGKIDPAFFRPSTDEWYILLSSTNYTTIRTRVLGFNIPVVSTLDLPVPGDYDGDGITDIAVYHPALGAWRIQWSSDNTIHQFTWGNRTDIPVPGDYDGDGKTDLAVYRPSTGQWRIQPSSLPFFTPMIVTWGASTDIPVPGDYDGDGKTDIAVYHPANGQWQIMQSATSTPLMVQWGGSPGDIPQPGDYDGDGKTDLGVYRNGTWFVRESHTNYTSQWSLGWGGAGDQAGPSVEYANTLTARAQPPTTDAMRASDVDGDGTADITVYQPATATWLTLLSSWNFLQTSTQVWGASGVVPVPGDYDGDGKADRAYFDPATGNWNVLLSSTSYTTSMSHSFGVLAGAKPVPGDYDGDGLTDMAVFIPASGEWRILTSSSNFVTLLTKTWGTSDDRPVPADYDGDGKTDIAFFRPSTGEWQVLFSSSNYTTSMSTPWGVSTDVLIPGDYDGDGKADLAVYRPSVSTWYVLYSQNNFTTQSQLSCGANDPGATPVVGDFDGDGKVDFGLFTTLANSGGQGVLQIRTANTGCVPISKTIGASSDLPMPSHP
jgi:hypothetical protein